MDHSCNQLFLVLEKVNHCVPHHVEEVKNVENNEFDEAQMKKKVSFYAKVAQTFFLALFLLGLSSGIGDYTAVLAIPLSAFSVSSMTYGLVGAIACEYVSRRFSA